MSTTQIATQKYKHPRAMYLISTMIACEVFSFYCMKDILLYYLKEVLLMQESVALTMSATFSSLCSISGIVGGILADKFLGMRFSIYFGLCMMGLGHIILSTPIPGIFTYGLATLVIGGAFVSIPATVLFGKSYKKNDHRRVQGFTIMYTMFNLATFFSALLSEWVAIRIGWHYGFGLAAVVLFIGLFIFYIKRDMLSKIEPDKQKLNSTKLLALFFGSIFMMYVFNYIINNSHYFKYIISIITICVIIYFAYITRFIENVQSVVNLILASIGCIITLSLVVQLHYAFMLFSKRNVDKWIKFPFLFWDVNFELTNNMLTMFNPVAVVLFGMMLTKLWQKLSLKQKEPSDVKKLVYGPIITSVGLGCLYLITFNAGSDGMIPYYYAIFTVCVLSCAELFAQPIGWAVFTNESPEKYTASMLGIFKLSIGIISFVGGMISKIVAIDDSGHTISANESLLIYREGFLKLFLVSIVLAILFAALILFSQRYFKSPKHNNNAVS